jgi:hypothetical protein
MADEVPAGSFAHRDLLFGALALQADLLVNDGCADAYSALGRPQGHAAGPLSCRTRLAGPPRTATASRSSSGGS